MKSLFLVLVVLVSMFFVGTAQADEEPPSVTTPAHIAEAIDGVRVGTAASIGFAEFHRSVGVPSVEAGATIGGELRVHPYSSHGFLAGFMYGGGIFGPTVTTLDADYSLCVSCPRSLEGVTGAVYLDVGPSLGFVHVSSGSPLHHVLGGRVAAAADLQLGSFTVGLMLGYRGGVPIDKQVRDDWEGAVTIDARLGFAFDFGKQR
jgi:hypothetical protein